MRRRISVRKKSGRSLLPRGATPDASVTLPQGARLKEVRLVCLESHQGAPGNWVITNEDGTLIYLCKEFRPGDPPFSAIVEIPSEIAAAGLAQTLRVGSPGTELEFAL